MPACSGGVVCKWTNKDKEDHHLDNVKKVLFLEFLGRNAMAAR